MAVRRSSSVRMQHNENVTPEKRATPSPKSKKCLDLTLAASPKRRRGPPLNAANSLTAGWIQSHHGTPQKENSKEEIPAIETSPSRHSSKAASCSPKASPISVPASPTVSTGSPLSLPASPAVSTGSPLSLPASPDMFAATPSGPPSQWPLSTLSPCNLQTPRSALSPCNLQTPRTVLSPCNLQTPKTVLSVAPVRRRSLLSNILVKSSVSKRSQQKLEGISSKSPRPYLPNQPTSQEAAKNQELAEAIKSIGKVSFYKSKPRKNEDADRNKEVDRDSILDNNNKVEEKSEANRKELKTPMESESEVLPTKSSLEVMKEETTSLSDRSASASLRRRSTSIIRSKRATGGRRSIGGATGGRRSTRGVKRKSHDGSLNSGVGHAIKKPRYNPKPKAELPSSQPTVKTQILSYSDHKVEGVKQILQHSGATPFVTTLKGTTQSNSGKPTVDQTPKEMPESSSGRPTAGQISMTRHTRVSYEMKGGKMVFRKTPKTPLRRSPRKKMNQSPNSKNYFSPKPGNLTNHVRSTPKLFSPKQNYLHPQQTSSPVKAIPSPVKFNKSPQDEDSMEVGSGTHTVGTLDDNQSITFGQAPLLSDQQADISFLGDQQVGISLLSDQQADISLLSDQQADISSLGDRQADISLLSDQQADISSLGDQQVGISLLSDQQADISSVDPSSYSLVNLPPSNYPTYATEEEVALNSTPLFYQPPETIEQLLEVMESTGQFGPSQPQVAPVDTHDHMLNMSVDATTDLESAAEENGVNGIIAVENGVNGLVAVENGPSALGVGVQPLTAALAVSSILANLSSSSASSGDSDSLPDVDEDSKSTSSSKLFPIFYKSGAARGSVNDPPAAVHATSKRFVLSETDHTQRVIDAGQKVIGATLCLTCGTVYSVGDPQDELQHSNIHSGMMEKLNFSGWKHERVVGEFACGRVIMVKPEDHKHMWNKVEEVLSIVDKDLGFSEVGIRAKHQTKSFMFVADRKVVGLLLAETVETGYRMLPQSACKDNDSSAKVYCCSEQPTNIICGISRIWVLADYRRKKIASSLVDCFRSQFVYGHYLREDQFAFSDPTLNGIDFATKYMGNQEFLVYNR